MVALLIAPAWQAATMAWMSCDANPFVLKSVFSSINTCPFAYRKHGIGSPCRHASKN